VPAHRQTAILEAFVGLIEGVLEVVVARVAVLVGVSVVVVRPVFPGIAVLLAAELALGRHEARILSLAVDSLVRGLFYHSYGLSAARAAVNRLVAIVLVAEVDIADAALFAGPRTGYFGLFNFRELGDRLRQRVAVNPFVMTGSHLSVCARHFRVLVLALFVLYARCSEILGVDGILLRRFRLPSVSQRLMSLVVLSAWKLNF
jgi:hypothetical protein